MSKFKNTEELEKAYEELEREFTKKSQELAEKDRQLKYPYKNDVIEKQYEDLKDGIKFRIENNITDDWEQHYHCIDILCEKHKARIRDVENGICKIEQLELLLNAKEKMKTQSLKGFEKLKQQLAEKNKEITKLKSDNHSLMSDNAYQEADIFELKQKLTIQNQDKISFAVAELEKVKMLIHNAVNIDSPEYDLVGLYDAVSNQIKAIKGEK